VPTLPCEVRTVTDWPAGLPGYCHEDYEPHALCVPRQWYEDALAENQRLRAEVERLKTILWAINDAILAMERGGDGV